MQPVHSQHIKTPMGGSFQNEVVFGKKVQHEDRWDSSENFGPNFFTVIEAVKGLDHVEYKSQCMDDDLPGCNYATTDDMFVCLKLPDQDGCHGDVPFEALQSIVTDQTKMDQYYLALQRLGISKEEAGPPRVMTCLCYSS